MITIISVGKKHEEWIRSGLERYEKRLKKPFDVEWVLLAHSSLEGASARLEESERILSRLDDRSHVVLLDENGTMHTTPEVSTFLERWFSEGRSITLIIGGAYGVSDALHRRANECWSLSKLVFPHQLVRLLLVEQLYRAQEIARGGKYHHE